MADRYFSTTAEFKRMKLDEAFKFSVDNATPLKDVLSQFSISGSQSIEATGGVQSSSSNGHASSAFQPGQNQAASQEIAQTWKFLLASFNTANLFLTRCANYGQQAFQIIDGAACFPNPLPSVSDPAIILETEGYPFGRWDTACGECGIDPSVVVNQTVNDSAIYVWMQTQMLRTVRQTQGSYLYMGAAA